MDKKGEVQKNSEDLTEQERHLLETLPLVKKIASRKLNSLFPAAAEDITQKVITKLWKWWAGQKGRELTSEEWKKLANTAAQNEVKSFYSNGLHRETLLEDQSGLIEIQTAETVAGNSRAELGSLAKIVWEELKTLSLRQKYALLLQKQELIFYLISSQHCRIDDVAEELKLSKERFLEIFDLLPIPDERIGVLFFEATGEQIFAKQVWEARSKARTKLYKVLK